MAKVRTPSDRRLCWNGLGMQLADCWQATVHGARHILIEQDFQPILEIRWEKNEGRSMAVVLPKICQQLSTAFGAAVSELIPPPPPFAAAADRSHLAWLSWQNSDRPKALLWLSPSCQTLALLRFTDLSPAADAGLLQLIASLRDSDNGTATGEWSIQDISFHPPHHFELDAFHMAAGLTSIGFKADHSKIVYYRLAPASEHLRRQSLRAILQRLDGQKGQNQCYNETTNSCEYQAAPRGLAARLAAQLRRQKAYCWSRIWHLRLANRLLAVVFASNRPIPAELKDRLCRQYAIQST